MLALERTSKSTTGRPAALQPDERDPSLNILVLFTSVEATLAALKRASALAQSMGARLTLLVPQIVPHPLPLESPPVLLDWNEHHFSVIARESSVETAVQIYLCRDRIETLAAVLKPRSIVVLGARKTWWPTSEKRLAYTLRRAGHDVILTPTE